MKERIKGAFTKRKILHFLKMALFVVALSLILLSLLGTVAHATGLVDDTINAENLYSKYPLSNYQLDFYVDNSWSWLPWNWLDGIGKSVQYGLYCITNFVWTISLYLSNATGYVVQEAYKLDFINDMADSIGQSIQTLAGVTENGFSSTGFYVGFLLLIILIVGLYVAYTGLIKRETSKALHAVINFVVVFVLSASFIAYAPDYIKKINEFSSDISTASLDLGTKIMLPNSDIVQNLPGTRLLKALPEAPPPVSFQSQLQSFRLKTKAPALKNASAPAHHTHPDKREASDFPTLPEDSRSFRGFLPPDCP